MAPARKHQRKYGQGRERTEKTLVKSGKGFLSDGLQYLSNLLNQNGFKASTKRNIERVGLKRIRAITVMRDPIQGAINGVLDVLSLGSWSKLKSKYGFDQMFHLYCVITLDDGSKWILQKNANIDLAPWDNRPPTSQHVVPLNSDLEIGMMLEKTRKMMGDNAFFQYDAFKNNCQDFMLAFLGASGLLTSQIRFFIKQDIEALQKEMPSITKGIANLATDIGHQVGAGLHRKDIRTRLNRGCHYSSIMGSEPVPNDS